MKKFSNLIVNIFAISLVLVLIAPAVTSAVGVAPTFVDAFNYSILGGAAITNTGATTASGDVGVSPGTSIGGGISGAGTHHSNDTSAINAQADATTVYNNLNSQACDFGPVGPTDLAGAVLTPGVYCYSSSAQISVGGTLHLDALGNPNAVWIFKIGSTLTTISGASVVFDNVGSACNVFWQIGSSTTLGTTTSFIGNIVAAHDITLLTGATVNGRILARGVSADGTVVLDTNTISGPTCTTPINGVCGTAVQNYAYTATSFGANTLCSAGTASTNPAFPSPGNSVSWVCAGISGGTTSGTCMATVGSTPPAPITLTLVKSIVGGTKVFADFPLTATGPTVITGASASPTVTNAVVSPGTYVLSEITQSNYASGAWSCIKNTDPAVVGSSIVLVSGDNAICTVQNVYTAPVAPPVGVGGNNYRISSSVPPLIDVVKVPSPLALPAGPGLVTYTYTVKNIGTVPVTNVTLVDNYCSPMVFVSGDVNSDLKLDVNEIWTYDCFKTLSVTQTNTVTATGWANGISATDIANATVVVGAHVLPPLIHITKTPSPLLLPAGGGLVTYTKKVTNPGTVSLSNVLVVDDKCGPVTYVSGDINGNLKLEPTEVWTYVCSSNLTKTTTNTVTATGQANGFTARDFAIATVVVASPGLPNTGFPPQEKGNMLSIILTGIVMIVLVSIIQVFFKKNK